MKSHILDQLYSPLSSVQKLFRKGWGAPTSFEGLQMPGMVPLDEIEPIRIKWSNPVTQEFCTVTTGSFRSPFTHENFPKESRTAWVQFIEPRPRKKQTKGPVYVHFPATGDAGFARRANLFAIPLAKQGISSMVLEGPFYGKRKPQGQFKTCLKTVEQLLLLGLATIIEGRSLLKWLQDHGYGPLGVSGLSRGGQMAAITAAVTPMELAICPCIAPHSAAPVFTIGLIKKCCDWQALTRTLGQLSGNLQGSSAIKSMYKVLTPSSISRYPLPATTKATVMVGAKSDGFVLPSSIRKLHRHWPGAELRWVTGGHVSSFIFSHDAFRKGMVDAMERLC